MTKDEIAQAMQDSAGNSWGNEAHFQRFAALIRAAEREAMAKDWEARHGYDKHGVAAAIRARGNT